MRKLKNVILSIFSLPLLSFTISADTLNVCDDQNEWPPFSFFSREDGKPDKQHISGANTELLREAFKLANIEYTIHMIPWKRCLYEVYNYGESKQYEAFVNGSYNTERAERYYVSNAIYKTHDALFYSKKKFPNGLSFKKSSDLNNYSICGVFGYQYEYLYNTYGLKKNIKIDDKAKTLISALEKVSLGRCDVLSNSFEPVFGGDAVGLYNIPEDIGHLIIPNGIIYTYHMFISKSSPRANDLITKFNKALLTLQQNGRVNEIFGKFIPYESEYKEGGKSN